MTNRMMHLQSTDKARGDIELVSLGFILPNKGVSSKLFSEETLASNPEVSSYLASGRIVLTSSEEYAAKQVEQTRQAEKAMTVSDALEQDNPFKSDALKYINAARQALADLERELNKSKADLERELNKSNSAKAGDKLGTEIVTDSKDGQDDDMGLPMAPPRGLKPQVLTETYLRKDQKEKKAFLRTCKDIGSLRDIALFEPDAKMKAAARRAAKAAETQADSVTNLESLEKSVN